MCEPVAIKGTWSCIAKAVSMEVCTCSARTLRRRRRTSHSRTSPATDAVPSEYPDPPCGAATFTTHRLCSRTPDCTASACGVRASTRCSAPSVNPATSAPAAGSAASEVRPALLLVGMVRTQRSACRSHARSAGDAPPANSVPWCCCHSVISPDPRPAGRSPGTSASAVSSDGSRRNSSPCAPRHSRATPSSEPSSSSDCRCGFSQAMLVMRPSRLPFRRRVTHSVSSTFHTLTLSLASATTSDGANGWKLSSVFISCPVSCTSVWSNLRAAPSPRAEREAWHARSSLHSRLAPDSVSASSEDFHGCRRGFRNALELQASKLDCAPMPRASASARMPHSSTSSAVGSAPRGTDGDSDGEGPAGSPDA
mmetsp:Transcript_24682/g.79436  ORF Transcript_24682/g.79436 Transcript_24682/m.79436 type:complete len:367 (-) Transcript_24682:89-1189(-)